MTAETASSAAALQAYSGVFVFGDSLVDPGNDLKAAQFLGRFPFVSIPDGAPTADKGYFEGRFSNGYNFADLVSNKALHLATQPTFPFGVSSALVGLSNPFANPPSGDNLSFAYGGANAVGGANPAPSLHDQTQIYTRFTPDPNALYVINAGSNDVLSLVPTGGTPVTGAHANASISAIASQITQEVNDLLARGVRHVLVVDIPDLGVVPAYTGAQDEATRRALLTQYAEAVNAQIKSGVSGLSLPAGATVNVYDFFAYTDAARSDPARYAFTNVTDAQTVAQPNALDPTAGFLFFDKLHPTAQTHAQVASEILDALSGGPVNWTDAPAIGSQAAGAIPVGGAHPFTATLTAGQTYVVDALGVSSAAGTLADPLVRVLDAAGAVVAQDDDGGRGLDSHLQFTAPSSGAFTIEVDGVGVSGGSFHLQAGTDSGTNLLLNGALQGSNVTVAGGAANDTIAALAGDNHLRGFDGADSIVGGSGFDDVNGNMGADTLVGRSTSGDWLLGGQGDDLINALQSTGRNIVNGNLGADSITGGAGADTLRGGQGADWIRGAQGDDWISGDLGDNTVTGGAGADTFHASAGNDRVTDFNLAQGDRVLLDPGVTHSESQVGADAVVTLSTGGQMILVGVQAASLTGDWIVGG